ncbi:MAG: Smr domain protein [Myxococcaceae bacterium]|nr:Smr domain protein [Myxococcaceae bacterium]
MTKRTPGPDPFNNPFSKVKLAEPKKAEPSKPVAPPPPRKEKPVALDAEAALFLEAMGEVLPTKADKKHAAPAPGARLDPVKVAQEESESLAQLAELVSTEGPFEVTDSGDRLEGRVRGFDAQVLKRLRTGGFRLEGTLDLHGHTRDKAQAALEPFITQARRAGQRCVLVITGKGLNSADQQPVLRASLQQWLTQGRLARHVLAFCSAQPADGGSGAVYVLLRR